MSDNSSAPVLPRVLTQLPNLNSNAVSNLNSNAVSNLNSSAVSNPPVADAATVNAVSAVATAQVDAVINSIEGALNGQPLTKLNIVRVVATCMQVTEEMSALTGPQKKQVLMTALEKYLKEKPDLTEEDRESLLTIALPVVSGAVDTISEIRNAFSSKGGFFSCCK